MAEEKKRLGRGLEDLARSFMGPRTSPGPSTGDSAGEVPFKAPQGAHSRSPEDFRQSPLDIGQAILDEPDLDAVLRAAQTMLQL